MGIADKTMFEIYRERDYNRAFHVILYTELEEHGRNAAIAKAAAGETVFHGFLGNEHLEAARRELDAIVDDLNDRSDDDGAALSDEELRRRLDGYLVQ
ncbi:MAG: hypothetical protein R3B09_09850 [Nannocystaceae bacterium]